MTTKFNEVHESQHKAKVRHLNLPSVSSATRKLLSSWVTMAWLLGRRIFKGTRNPRDMIRQRRA